MAAARSRARWASAPPSTGRHRAAYVAPSASSTGSTRPRAARLAAKRATAARWVSDPPAIAPSSGGPEPPSPESRSTTSAAAGPRASTGTRQLASETRLRLAAAGVARSARNPGRLRADEFRRGQRPCAGRGQLQDQLVVDRLADRLLGPGPLREHVGQLGGLAGERMRLRQLNAGGRCASQFGPDAGGRSGSSAHRHSAPCAQTPVDYPHEVLPIAPAPTLTRG